MVQGLRKGGIITYSGGLTVPMKQLSQIAMPVFGALDFQVSEAHINSMLDAAV